jgi:hypothetical protein
MEGIEEGRGGENLGPIWRNFKKITPPIFIWRYLGGIQK